MSNELIFVLIFFWVVSAAYVMYTHNKHYTLGLDVIIFSIILGPILALFIGDEKHTIEKHHYIEANENDRHRRWFRTIGEINRQRISDFGRTIPPPPPISRRGPSHVELNMAERIRLENEKEKEKLKDFKFLKG